MRRIVYDFAMTLDNFICHEDDSVDGFVNEGPHLTDYLNRLEKYDTVVMGRKTYEFGYAFGLTPGDRAYPHMEHYIFSTNLHLDSDQVHIVADHQLEKIRELKDAEGADIYLCGGGAFAGFLLDHELVDQLVIKLSPVVFGAGKKAFGNSARSFGLSLVQSTTYDNGVMLLRYDVAYGS